jgi:hypothetical protein
MKTLNLNDDVIDSRDIVERITELESNIDDATGYPESGETLESMNAELVTLKAIIDEINDYAGDDCSDGVTLVNEAYFEEYMDDMIEDCYTLPKDLPSWMKVTYDYEALKQDYTTVEIDGTTYYYR